MTDAARTVPDPSTGGTPAQERKLRAQGRRTLARLLAAGLDVLAERGYREARVDDICEKAGVSHGTFYLYFANKGELFDALANEVGDEMRELVADLGPLSSGAAGFEELRTWLGRFAGLYEHHYPVIRVWQSDDVDPDLIRLGADILADLTATFADALVAAGNRNGLDPAQAAVATVAIVERVNNYLVARLRVDRDSMVDTLARIVHAGVFGGRPPKPRMRSEGT
ncbi:MAG: TetR/AcrR family transcriptional regulator [Acidimicrobiia bacterium]|nr:TetR/AcrR family transcriptional regulator [Acidimicrobiia bacterium]